MKEETRRKTKMKEEKEKKEENYVIGYKGLCSDLSSRYNINSDFKYELNKRYKLGSDQELKMCRTGFHFCRNKEDIFNFYEIDGINNYRFFEIRAYGNIIDDEENLNKNRIPKKSVTDEIEIVKEISLQEFISSPDVNFVRIDNKIPENLDLSTCKNLKTLIIYNCKNLKSIPENLPENLETLKIWDCNSLENLDLSTCKNLKSLEIWNCNSLENLPENLPKNLEYLEIKWCNSLKNLPEDLPENLGTLHIWDCNSLKSIPENLPENLKSLIIRWCNSLKNQYWNKSK